MRRHFVAYSVAAVVFGASLCITSVAGADSHTTKRPKEDTKSSEKSSKSEPRSTPSEKSSKSEPASKPSDSESKIKFKSPTYEKAKEIDETKKWPDKK